MRTEKSLRDVADAIEQASDALDEILRRSLYDNPPKLSFEQKVIAAVRNIEPDICARSARLIDAFVAKGRCDYIADFASRLPTGIFLGILGLPEDSLPQFMIWEDWAMRSQT